MTITSITDQLSCSDSSVSPIYNSTICKA